MSGFLLCIISFLLVFFSTYFLTCIFKSKRFENSIIYFALIFISQVIVSIEILSILKLINPAGLLTVNSIVFIISFGFWKYNKSSHLDFNEIKTIKNKIIYAVKRDKSLLLLLVFFIFASSISLFLALAAPTNSWDSMAYHLARIGFWLQNQSLAHFETSSIRQTIFPINSEIMILWPMIFLKRDYLAVLNEYMAYLGCIFILYSYLSYLKISTRRILWAIFILASLPAVILESSSAQNNLMIAFFLFTSLYLFVYGVKDNSKKAIVFSAIAFSINLGIKTTAFFFIPVWAIIYLAISIRARKKDFYKPIIIFVAAFIPTFLILSSYNYILNYIDFGNAIGTKFFIYRHSISVNIKTFMANLIRYFLLFFDFTGIKTAESLTPLYLNIKNNLFHLLGLSNNNGLLFLDIDKINIRLHENLAKFGVLGFLLILPLIFKYSFSKITSSRDKMFYISLTGLITIGFIFVISALMGFCIWNNRYLLSAIVLSSPLLALSYKRRLTTLKLLIILIVIPNFLLLPTFIESRPFFQICKMLPKYNFKTFRSEIRLRNEGDFKKKMPFYEITKYLGHTIPDNAKIGLIFNDDDWYYPLFEENSTWKIYPLRNELLIKRKNYNDYDYLVIAHGHQNIEMITDKKIVYNYTVKNGKVVHNKFKPENPVIIYYDRDVKPVTSGKPVYQINILNASDIPANFKRIKRLEIKNTSFGKDKKIIKFFVYKKIS